jgi:farnesyl-diphosphate farnesyltransferase
MIKDILSTISRPQEISAMLKLKFSDRFISKTESNHRKNSADYNFSYEILNRVSRSFAVVIQQLPNEIKDAICLFYLILRGLDSIEDDMHLEKEIKIGLLREFYKKLEEPGWNIKGTGDTADYRMLLEHFDKVISAYQQLDSKYRKVISNICMKMGNGMADFIDKEILTKEEYDLYCHYVAGLVGQGLSSLFVHSGLEDPRLERYEYLSNSMGLLLQKTNITRDYFEDIPQGRIFWPKEIWRAYAEDIRDLALYSRERSSISALNDMVADALKHLPDSIRYLSLIEDQQIFRFCAIPQIMAISTLSLLYNNLSVFSKNVKIRKGLAAKYMVYTNDYLSFCAFAFNCISEIQEKLMLSDPNYSLIHSIKEEIHRAVIHHQRQLKNPYYYG